MVNDEYDHSPIWCTLGCVDLKKELADPQLTRDKLMMLYVCAVRERMAAEITQPEPDTLAIKTADGETHKVFLENLWRELRQTDDPQTRVTTFERHVGVIALEADAEPGSKGSIVAIVRDAVYLGYAPEDIAKRHLVGDLWVLYALDLPTCTQTMRQQELVKLEVREDEVHELALQNLRDILPAADCEGEGPWYSLRAGDMYSSSLLLFEDIWSQLEEMVHGDVVAVVPSRDVVLFTGSDSTDGIRCIRGKARDLCEGGHHVISETLIRRVNGKWFVYD